MQEIKPKYHKAGWRQVPPFITHGLTEDAMRAHLFNFIKREIEQKDSGQEERIKKFNEWFWRHMVDKEIVICAAVLATDGTIVRGQRHSDCLATLRGIPGKEYEYGPDGGTRGFITSWGRYVNRKEGYRLQIEAGIFSVNPGGYLGDELYSEDLY